MYAQNCFFVSQQRYPSAFIQTVTHTHTHTHTTTQVENHLNESVEFEMYAQNCSSVSQQRYPVRTYDTYGASPWENIPDVLHMYGMCSYRDWFEYLEFIDPTDANRKNMGACSSSSAPSTCDPASFNVMESIWWDTLRPYAETSMPTLFSTKKFQASQTNAAQPK
jgi:hypothetical protein